MEAVVLILLALPVIIIVASAHRYLALYAPTNLLVRHVRAREPRWPTVAWVAAIALCLLLVADALAVAVARGAPGWLNLVLLVVAWDAIKLMVLATSAWFRFMQQACRVVFRRVAPRRAWS